MTCYVSWHIIPMGVIKDIFGLVRSIPDDIKNSHWFCIERVPQIFLTYL